MFFVFGSPRSGTTLLAQCISAHDDLVVPHETDFIIPMAFTFDRIRDPETGREVISKFVTESEFFERSLKEYVGKEELLEVIRACDYNPAEMLRAIYGLIAKKAGKKMGGDKSPNDLIFLRMLVKVGGIAPDTRIIHIVRDVRDVMVSITGHGMGGSDIWTHFARFWAGSNLYLHNLYKDQPDRYCLVRYEDFVADPETKLKEIAGMLGVEYQEKMLSPANRSQRYKDMDAHKNLYKPISKSRIGVYKEALDEKTLRLYEEQAREALEVFGYETGGRSGVLKKLFR